MAGRKRSDPNRPSWSAQLRVLKDDIEEMPQGALRDSATRRAQQLEAAIFLEQQLRPVVRTDLSEERDASQF